jgi:hypothetical protein
MWIVYAGVWLASAVAWAKATRANLRTSLVFTVIWGWIAWAALSAALLSAGPGSLYAALCLIGCAGVAVLGARWPGAAAWQFVVVALLGVMLLPFAEAVLRDRPLTLSGVRWAFLCLLLALVVVNYLPTRLGIASALIGAAGVMALFPILEWNLNLAGTAQLFGLGCTCAAPVVGWMCWIDRRTDRSASDRLWLDFRDRFGAIWALRLKEQFNRSAANAGLAATLTWSGVHGPDGPEVYDRLAALMTKFGLPANQNPGLPRAGAPRPP